MRLRAGTRVRAVMTLQAFGLAVQIGMLKGVGKIEPTVLLAGLVTLQRLGLHGEEVRRIDGKHVVFGQRCRQHVAHVERGRRRAAETRKIGAPRQHEARKRGIRRREPGRAVAARLCLIAGAVHAQHVDEVLLPVPRELRVAHQRIHHLFAAPAVRSGAYHVDEQPRFISTAGFAAQKLGYRLAYERGIAGVFFRNFRQQRATARRAGDQGGEEYKHAEHAQTRNDHNSLLHTPSTRDFSACIRSSCVAPVRLMSDTPYSSFSNGRMPQAVSIAARMSCGVKLSPGAA